jgi:ricin-type beta-trefoil lectin protein
MIGNIRKRLHRLVAFVGVPLVAAGAAVALTGAPAQAAFVNQGTFLISNGSQCLDVQGDGTANGTPLVLNFCDPSNNSQLFKIYLANDPEGRTYHQIQPYDGAWPLNKCVDLPGSNQLVTIYGCHGGSQQRLTLDPAGKIRKQGTSICIGTVGGVFGPLVRQVNCDNSIAPPLWFLSLVHN